MDSTSPRPTPQRILIVGPGALGLVTAQRLAAAGHHVILAARSVEKAAFLRTHGIRVDDAVSGLQAHAHVEAIASPEELSQPVDLLILATKAAGTGEITRHWLPALAAHGTLVPFQNGLLGDELAVIAGDRLLECAVYYPASLLGPGHSAITGAGHMHLGPWPRSTPAEIGAGSRTAAVAALLAHVVPTYTYTDMHSVKWNKLVANAAMTSLGVISGLGMGGMMQHKVIRNAFLYILQESFAIAQAAGAKPMKLGENNPHLLVRLPRFAAHWALRWATRKHGLYKSSSQQSLERGEATEVDFLNGRIMAEAKKLNLKAPWNAATVEAVHAIERNPASAGIAQVQALLARVHASS